MPRRIDPAIAVATMIKADLMPIEPYGISGAPWRCVCQRCGRVVAPTYNSVQQGRSHCEYCGGHKVDPRTAAMNMRYFDLEPLEPFPGSKSPWKCRCLRCDNIVTGPYASILKGSRCRRCGYRAETMGGRIDARDARRIVKSHGFSPVAPYVGLNDRWRVIHDECGNVVATMSLEDIKRRGRKCPWCNSNSMAGRLAVLYLIVNNERQLIKVGIQLASSVRVDQWRRLGWEVIDVWLFRDGRHAANAEHRIVTHWREEWQLPQGCENDELDGMRGSSETAPLDRVAVPDHHALVTQFVEAERITSMHPMAVA